MSIQRGTVMILLGECPYYWIDTDTDRGVGEGGWGRRNKGNATVRNESVGKS